MKTIKTIRTADTPVSKKTARNSFPGEKPETVEQSSDESPGKINRKTLKDLKGKRKSLKKAISKQTEHQQEQAQELARLKKKQDNLQYAHEQTLSKLEKASIKLKSIMDELNEVKGKLEEQKKKKKR